MSARDVVIDSLDFARNGRELHGTVPVADLARLKDVAAPAGEIRYVLRGLPAQDGKPGLKMRLEGGLHLTCQRCLQEMSYPVALHANLVLVPDGELDAGINDDDAHDAIPADRHLNVHALIEDELLLSLPFSPRHPLDRCQASVTGRNTGDDPAAGNPFRGLAALKNE